MASKLRGAIALLVLVALCACAQRAPWGPTGLLVTYSTRPLTTNFKQTPVVDHDNGVGSVVQLQYYVRVLWGDNSIGGLGKQAGFAEVHYADVTTFSIWTYLKVERVRVYGRKAGDPEPPAAQ
ncbi:MAG: hypothetical protein ACHQ6T_04565 [Myxococcota bacterium]